MANTDLQNAATFLARMLPYLAEGKSFEEAGRAVLQRDQELYNTVCCNHEVRAQFMTDTTPTINC